MPDGRLVIAGQSTDGSPGGASQYAIRRLLRDGGVDPSFAPATGNKVVGYCYMSAIASPLPPESHATAVVVQADGKIVIGGYCRPSLAALRLVHVSNEVADL